MTLHDVFATLSAQPGLLFILLMSLPVSAFLVNLWSGTTNEEIWRWRYMYTALVYLACLPGIFALTLNVYLFLFERQSIWDMNIGLQILPILTMAATLVFVNHKLPFKYIPGFGRLSSLLTLMTALMGILWIIDRTRIYAITYVPFAYVVVGFILLLLIIRFAWSRIF